MWTPFVSPNSSVDARAKMHSAEPNEPRYVNDPTHPAAGDGEAWRAEVALRVNSYRARRTPKIDENSPALDFGPGFEASGSGSETHGGQTRIASQVGKPRSSARPARRAVDTNYYRRLNAESMSQSSSVTMDATAAATAPAQELEDEVKAESNAALFEKLRAEAQDASALDLEIRPTLAEDSCLDRYCISEPEPEADSLMTPPAPTVQGNLIVFRRPFLEPPLVPQPSRDELAEPMSRRPRILEVPEDIMPAVQGSLFPEIRLDADEQEVSHHCAPEIEVPLRVALVSERLLASLTDMGVVMSAGMLFAGMAWRALPEIPHTKPFFMTLGAVTLLFWAVYQYMFLLYAGRTPGMSMRGIRLSTFDGRAPGWKQRASRTRFMFISFASVSLGFLWALVDEDALCWHDRISQTFPTNE
jgi:uncharacterized RDD family membrane protein YckC